MRDPGRIQEVLKVIEEVWSELPELRLMQLLLDAVENVFNGEDAYYLDDDELVEALTASYGD